MSEIVELAEKFAELMLQATSRYGIILTLLAVIGLISIISAIGQKVFLACRYLFMVFVAIPAILIVGLVNKDARKERLKDLGEIKAYLKQNPKKWKKALYFALLCIFVLVICLIVFFIITKVFLPFNSINELSKQVLQNYSMNQSNFSSQ